MENSFCSRKRLKFPPVVSKINIKNFPHFHHGRNEKTSEYRLRKHKGPIKARLKSLYKLKYTPLRKTFVVSASAEIRVASLLLFTDFTHLQSLDNICLVPFRQKLTIFLTTLLRIGALVSFLLFSLFNNLSVSIRRRENRISLELGAY